MDVAFTKLFCFICFQLIREQYKVSLYVLWAFIIYDVKNMVRI